MMEIKLNKGFIALVDDEDFEYLNQFKWSTHPSGNTIYVRRFSQYKRILMHRIIMNVQKGESIDHIDHNGLNCQKSNLRICTHQQNGWNQLSNRGKSKYKGVLIIEKNGRVYISAQIRYNGKKYHLGYFKTEEEAATGYNDAAKKYFGEFASLNIINKNPVFLFVGA